MENVSKALLIAAGVLIGINLLTVAIYLINIMGGFAAQTQSKIDRNAVAQFNEKFLKYNGLTNLTIQQVVTIKNYALENNNEFIGYNFRNDRAAENNEYIDVFLRRNLVLGTEDEKLLKDEMGKNFSCNVQVSTISGKVFRIEFTEIPG